MAAESGTPEHTRVTLGKSSPKEKRASARRAADIVLNVFKPILDGLQRADRRSPGANPELVSVADAMAMASTSTVRLLVDVIGKTGVAETSRSPITVYEDDDMTDARFIEHIERSVEELRQHLLVLEKPMPVGFEASDRWDDVERPRYTPGVKFTQGPHPELTNKAYGTNAATSSKIAIVTTIEAPPSINDINGIRDQLTAIEKGYMRFVEEALRLSAESEVAEVSAEGTPIHDQIEVDLSLGRLPAPNGNGQSHANGANGNGHTLINGSSGSIGMG